MPLVQVESGRCGVQAAVGAFQQAAPDGGCFVEVGAVRLGLMRDLRKI
ncbi:hypothetical protein [Streptomyces microflavus]